MSDDHDSLSGEEEEVSVAEDMPGLTTAQEEFHESLKAFTPEDVAAALFDEPVIGEEEDRKTKIGRPKVKDPPTPEQLSLENAAGKVIAKFQKYGLLVNVTSQPWPCSNINRTMHQQRFQGNYAICFFCSKCKERNLHCTIIATGMCNTTKDNDSDKFTYSIKIERVFFHDINCGGSEALTESAFLQRQLDLNGFCSVPFDFEEIIRSTYLRAIQKIENFDPKQATPPGDPINFGDGNYDLDNRTYQILPSDNYTEVNTLEHRNVFIRLLYHFASLFNVSEQVSPFLVIAPDDDRKKPVRAWSVVANPKFHLFFQETSLLFGGHNKNKGGKGKYIHQPLHKDSEDFDNLIDENKALEGLFIPGSIIVPLFKTRTIYIHSPSNKVTVKVGEYLYFKGNLPHGGITYDVKDPCWYTALHAHLDSKHHERVQGFFALHYDKNEEDVYLPIEQMKFANNDNLCEYFQEKAEKNFAALFQEMKLREKDLPKKVKTVLSQYESGSRFSKKRKSSKRK